MDPQELAMQIQMFEEIAKQHQRKQEKEAIRESKSMSQKKASEDKGGYDGAQTKQSSQVRSTEEQKRTGKKQSNDGFFNSDGANQGGAASFDFDFDSSTQPKSSSSSTGPKEN